MSDALFLLLILILGLLLCSFLGGNCGKEGFKSTTAGYLVTGTTYTDTNGNSITVISSNNGGQSLKLVKTGETTPIILTTTPPSGTTATTNTYYAQPPLKLTAESVKGSNGKTVIMVNFGNGEIVTLTPSDSSSSNTGSSSSSSGSSSSSSGSSSSSSTNYDSYNHYSGTGSSTQLQTGTIFTTSNGDTITVVVNSDGTQSLQYTQVNQTTPIVFVSTPPSGTTATVNTYYAPSMTATVFTDSNGQIAVKITNTSNGQTTVFTQSGSGSITSTQYYGSTGYPYPTSASTMSYDGAYGGSAGAVTGPNGNTAYYAQGPNGTTTAGTTSSYNPYYNGTSSTQYYGQYGGSAGAVTGPNGNTAYYAQGPYGNTTAGTTSSSNSDYYNSLPPGIPASQIPQGQEDLYILKSQVVPPVCPVCPSNSSSSNDPDSAEKCPPCPACARCPEPSFECKKVPNYNAINNSYLPQPVISDFSSFGM